jgi:hypothetical protein
METEPIGLRFTVACSPAHAFGVDAMRTSLWLALLLDNCYR